MSVHKISRLYGYETFRTYRRGDRTRRGMSAHVPSCVMPAGPRRELSTGDINRLTVNPASLIKTSLLERGALPLLGPLLTLTVKPEPLLHRSNTATHGTAGACGSAAARPHVMPIQ